MKRFILLTVMIYILAGCALFEKEKKKRGLVRPAKQKREFIHRPAQRPGPVVPSERVTGPLSPTRQEDDLLRVTKARIGTTEFHFTGKYCTECHEQTPTRGGDTYLKFGGDYYQLCGECHLTTPGSYIHPTNMVPSEDKRVKFPADFPLEDDKVTCLTCHDLYMQCQKRDFDRDSLRGVPYRQKTDFCFKCHDQGSYVMFNPHAQVNGKGEVITDKCLYCHTEIPDQKQDRFEDPKLIGDLGPLCQRCHIRMAMRSGSFSHLAKPSAETLARIRKTEEEFYATLPLDAQGKTTCATCHNPHDKGVISAEKPAAKGAGSTHRLRLPDPMCKWCHPMPISFEKKEVERRNNQ